MTKKFENRVARRDLRLADNAAIAEALKCQRNHNLYFALIKIF